MRGDDMEGPLRRKDKAEFVVEFLRNCNEKICVGGIEMDRIHLRGILESYHDNLVHKINGTFRITGADKAHKFAIYCAGNNHLERLAKDIWKNPEKYWDISKEELESDGGWDSFLKYLWVDGWNGTKDVRLGDFVENLENAKQVLSDANKDN